MSWFSSIFHRTSKAGSPQRPPTALDLPTAKRVAQSLELNNPELVVAGIRRAYHAGKASWTIDVVNRLTGRMTSLAEQDDWARRLQEILPCRSTEDARVVQRPALRV